MVDEPSETPEAALFAPATADTLARLARGLETVSARRATVTVVAPDLDAGTAEHPAVRENLRAPAGGRLPRDGGSGRRDGRGGGDRREGFSAVSAAR